eukprot:Nitzschia sp. Nitz4//scaffold219_size35776//29376//35535//NITZ4_007828-RA/size35776-processed-gene-0.11-mRNA-1//1//CDS//3329542332//6313//frame0
MVELGFTRGNLPQLALHFVLASLIGLTLRLTTFHEATNIHLGAEYLAKTSFLVSFGFTKALSNVMVGRFSDVFGRRWPHAVGWAVGIILGGVLLLLWESVGNSVKDPTSRGNKSLQWFLYTLVNILLGAQQGWTWTSNIFMHLDILGPSHRAMATAIANSVGYLSSAMTTYLAAVMSPRVSFLVVLLTSVLGLFLSLVFLKDTSGHVAKEILEQNTGVSPPAAEALNVELNGEGEETNSSETEVCHVAPTQGPYEPVGVNSRSSDGLVETSSFRTILVTTCWENPSAAVLCWGGLTANLVTSFAWGLVLIWGKQQELTALSLASVGSGFTFSKGITMLLSGYASDRWVNRKGVLLAGFTIAAVGLVLTGSADQTVDVQSIYWRLFIGGIVVGTGIGGVYCVMTAALSDHTLPQDRASAIGVYKLWRDSGYAFGGLLTGLVADVSGGSFVTTTTTVAALVGVLVVAIAVKYQEVKCHSIDLELQLSESFPRLGDKMMRNLLLLHRRVGRAAVTTNWKCVARSRFNPSSAYSTSRVLASGGLVRIGDVEIPRGTPSMDDRHLVPTNYLDSPEVVMSPTFRRHLQWMMSKDLLGQDMLLIGPPGAGAAYRRRIVMAYAELVQKPVEVLTLGSDLTESDLKQRRELVLKPSSMDPNNPQTAVEFRDQAPVRAAKHGRLLVLDGLERAERNVLPTLNNLLENREMHLEDGNFLISPQRYEKLQNSSMSAAPAAESFLTPVHPDFRVIALGVPTPPYPGRSLDPPIRSRFQIRRVDNPTSDELLQQLMGNYGIGDEQIARYCATFGGAMQNQLEHSPTKSATPDFPFTSLTSAAQTLQQVPDVSNEAVLLRAYPLATKDSRIDEIFGPSGRKDEIKSSFWTATKAVQMAGSDTSEGSRMYKVISVEKSENSTGNTALATVQLQANSGSSMVALDVPCGSRPLGQAPPGFVETVGSSEVLVAMMQEHAVGKDLLLVSPKGEGKNATAQQFAGLLGYDSHLFAMYSEMGSQDLLLRRATDQKTGQTKWEESPLLKAAVNGDICVLDGVEKLRLDVLSSLQSIAMDRETTLPDGRKLLRADRLPSDYSDDNVLVVHPSFRLVALASLKKDAGTRWITPDLMSMFSTVVLPTPSEACQRAILNAVNPACEEDLVTALLKLQEVLTGSVAEDCGVAPLSTRNLIRVVRQVGADSSIIRRVLSSILLVDLLPPSQRALLESVLDDCGIPGKGIHSSSLSHDEIIVDDRVATIGDFSIERATVTRPEMVPSTKAFFEIPCHVSAMRDLLTDWSQGERSFLLLGNQGVGKNMITDRICEIANWEREYIQLHRDSTIGQLTLTPTLEDGRIVWKDSPLVRAIQQGCPLVVDEADKAPVEVISVLKGLVEDGELLLADGRRISKYNDGPGFIPIHPDFSLWVLANRPGFPFLGNDFFREIGDCFSTRVIQNPDLQSEIQLLQSYGPDVDTKLLRAIAGSFSELRHLADNGEITYPYSTREAVAVVKHLQRFPQETVVGALHNVLDFDSFDDTTYSTLGKVFQRHDIEVSDYVTWREAMARVDAETGGLEIEVFGKGRDEGESQTPKDWNAPKLGKWDDANEPHIGGNQWAGGTGGSDTAGLGGRGGPFRLDRGHNVFQVSDQAKAQVSEEAQEAAREMGRQALEERLKEISMSQREWEMYQRFGGVIQEDVSRLRGVLDTTISKSDERGWLRRQSHGEIDDTKLVDGVTGDKYIFKRRGMVEDTLSHKKKKIRFVMDCSGSMYRFNGYDQRLVRCLEAALLVMEAFEGFESRYEYSIVGHSGDSPSLSLVDFGEPPKNENDRMKVLQTMIAHSQYCRSGDFTCEAMEMAIEDVSNSAGDDPELNDCIVIGVSDANLARYGISPRELGKILESGEQNKVKAYCVFIASFGEEADEIKRSLPIGRGHICFKTSDLPKIVRDILTSNLS